MQAPTSNNHICIHAKGQRQLALPVTAFTKFRDLILESPEIVTSVLKGYEPDKLRKEWREHRNGQLESRYATAIYYLSKTISRLEEKKANAEGLLLPLKAEAVRLSSESTVVCGQADRHKEKLNSNSASIKVLEKELVRIDAGFEELTNSAPQLAKRVGVQCKFDDSKWTAAGKVSASPDIKSKVMAYSCMASGGTVFIDIMPEVAKTIISNNPCYALVDYSVKTSDGLKTTWLASPAFQLIFSDNGCTDSLPINELLALSQASMPNVKSIQRDISRRHKALHEQVKAARTFLARKEKPNGGANGEDKSFLQLCRDCLALGERTLELMNSFKKAQSDYIQLSRESMNCKAELVKCNKRKEELDILLGGISIPPGAEARIALLSKRTDELKGKQEALQDALGKILRKKERTRLHSLNSPQEGKIPVSGEIRLPEPTVKAPEEKDTNNGNGVMSIEVEVFVSLVISHFSDFCQSNPNQAKRFRVLLERLAKVYVRNGGKMHREALLEEFPGLVREEHVRPGLERSIRIIRLGFDRREKFRLLLNIADPENPVIMFVGHKLGKKGSDSFMKKRYIHDFEKARKDGRAYWFNVFLGGLAVPHNGNGK